VLGLFVLIFASLGLGWWLGDVMNSRAGGFFAVAGFYLLLVLCVVLMKKKIIFPYIRNLFIRKVYD
jgi:hypothetical protein